MVTLQGFVPGKLEKFASVTDFSPSKLPRESFIVWASVKTARKQKNVLWISLDNYPKQKKGKIKSQSSWPMDACRRLPWWQIRNYRVVKLILDQQLTNSRANEIKRFRWNSKIFFSPLVKWVGMEQCFKPMLRPWKNPFYTFGPLLLSPRKNSQELIKCGSSSSLNPLRNQALQ